MLISGQCIQRFFSDNTGNILSGVIASLIVILLQVLVLSGVNFLSALLLARARLSRLWGYSTCDRIYVISGAIEGTSSEVRAAIIAGPDADAANTAMATLGFLCPTSDIRHVYSSSPSSFYIKENICIVGGPINNAVSRLLLDALNVQIHFDDLGFMQIGKDKFSVTYTNDIPKTDLAVIVLSANPFFPAARCVAFMGYDTYGVLAAALTLSKRVEAEIARRQLEKALGLRRYIFRRDCIAVLSCKVLEHDVSCISLLAIYNMKGEKLWKTKTR